MKKFLLFFIFSFNVFFSLKNVNANSYEEKIDIKKHIKESENNNFKHWSKLPIWGDEARKKGYDIELPFVIAFNYLDQSQYIKPVEGSVKYINLKTENVMTIDAPLFGPTSGGIALKEDGTPDITVKMGKTKEHTKTKGARIGFWPFPFLQIYGVYNEITGYSTAHETSRTRIATENENMNEILYNGTLDKIIRPIVEKITGKGTYEGKGIVSIEDTVIINLDATSYGMGFTVAGGYKKLFAMIDTNYTYSKLKISDDYIKTLVVSSRIGYNTKMFERPLRVWAGGMGQYVSSKLSGRLTGLSFGGNTNSLMKPATLENSMFEVKQNLASPISLIVGGRYTFAKYSSIMIEGNIGGKNGRNSLLINFEILF